MLKRKVDYLDAIAPAAEKAPEKAQTHLRLINDDDAPVESAARGLQHDIARVFAQENTWSVRRTVAIGVVFHIGVFCALGLAASGAISQLPH
jgi:hypothetical protein